MKIATGAVVALLVLTGCSSTTEAAAPTPSPSFVVPSSSVAPPPVEPAEPVVEPLVVGDFKVTPKVLSKQCFGSAGCSVDVRLDLTAVTSNSDGRAAELTVTITGDESGEIIETIEVDEAGQYSPPEVSLSTPRSSTKIEALVTDVTEV